MKFVDIEDYTLNPKFPLLDEQQEGVRFLLTRSRAILAFQTGLGKTYTSLTALEHVLRLKSGIKGIIVCPVKALKAFRRELYGKLGYKEDEVGWATNQGFDVDEGTNKIIVFTYTSLEKYSDIIVRLSKRNHLVALMDEAHKLVSSKTKIAELLGDLKSMFDIIWLCTATPLLNDIEGLYNIVGYLNKDLLGGSKTKFLNRYTLSKLKTIYLKGGKQQKVREITGYQNMDELKSRLEKICIVRQKKYNLKFGYLHKEMSEYEAALYEQVSSGIMSEEEESSFSGRMHDLQRLVDNSYTNDLINPSLDSPNTKETLFLESLEKIFSKDYSVVVYCDYKDTVSRLKDVLERHRDRLNLNNVFEISGDVKVKDREAVEDAITERDVIIITSAGSESINLQKANCVMFYDIPFSVGTCLQVIGRITRVDTKHAFQYVFVLYVKGTIDEYKYLLFLDNANLIKQLIGSDANMPSNLRELEKKNLEDIKTKLLWHYKDVGKKEINRKKKLIKNGMIVAESSNYLGELGNYYLNLNPFGISPNGTKRAKAILPSEEDLDLLIRDKSMGSIFRNKYIDKLKSKESKDFMCILVDKIVNKNEKFVFVDDYGIGSILREFIIDNVRL